MRREHTVKVHVGDSIYSAVIEEGNSILEAVVLLPGVEIETPCGGNGICGKCRIQVLRGTFTSPGPEELRLIRTEELDQGIRLACCCYPDPDLGDDAAIRVPESSLARSVLTDFERRTPQQESRFTVLDVPIDAASLSDQRSLADRITSRIPCSDIFLQPPSLSKLASFSGRPSVPILADRGRAVRILETGEQPFGIAADIGTTTVAVYLVDLVTGAIAGHKGEMNKQRRYGADVISRIQYASKDNTRPDTLTTSITGQLDRMMHELIVSLGYSDGGLIEIVIAGNTVMLHLLSGVSPASLAEAPFIPVFTHPVSVPPALLGFSLCTGGHVLLLGSISAYVGADITAGIYASAITEFDHPVLFVDIGTNGESVLWDGKKLFCCSSAAGPAFEGASILHGTGGVAGAVCAVGIRRSGINRVSITSRTIDNAEAAGICGSGIIDAAAALLDLGLIDETGRMVSVGEDPWGVLEDTPHGTAVRICTSGKGPVYLTQADVRQIQLAKAAVAGGIRTLLEESSTAANQIGTVIIAGGFGQHIHIPSALRIGLLPPEIRCDVRAGGNTAGKGAVEALLDPEALDRMKIIRDTAQYIELSSSPSFQTYFIDEMIFPPPGGQNE